MNEYLPKISIITATYNAEQHISECIDSVASQTYPNIEHIIIDGASSDSTVQIVNNNINRIAYFITEKDNGISDAFNKGIKAATGDYLFFLGADDTLYSKSSIADIFDTINYDEYDIVCGKIKRISEDGTKVLWESKPKFQKESLLFRMSLPHQATFTHKRFFAKFGLFRSDIKFSMDYEILLRAYKDFPKVKMIDSFVALWRAGGVGHGKILDIYKEYDLIKREHHAASPLTLKIIYLWIYLKYLVRHKLLYFVEKH